MAGILTRKSNFSDLESFDDFPIMTAAAPVAAPEASPDTPSPSVPVEASQAAAEPDSLPPSNPHLLAHARKEKSDLHRLALQSGYTIDNLVEKPIPARLEPESNTFLKTIRIEVADWNRFQRWCHSHSYSHKKGFKALTQKLPVK